MCVVFNSGGVCKDMFFAEIIVAALVLVLRALGLTCQSVRSRVFVQIFVRFTCFVTNFDF